MNTKSTWLALHGSSEMGFMLCSQQKLHLHWMKKKFENLKTKTWLLCVCQPLNTNMLALMSLHWRNIYLFSLSFSLSFLFLPSFSSLLSLQELFPLGSLQTWTQWIQQLWQVLQFPFKKLWWYIRVFNTISRTSESLTSKWYGIKNEWIKTISGS